MMQIHSLAAPLASSLILAATAVLAGVSPGGFAGESRCTGQV